MPRLVPESLAAPRPVPQAGPPPLALPPRQAAPRPNENVIGLPLAEPRSGLPGGPPPIVGAIPGGPPTITLPPGGPLPLPGVLGLPGGSPVLVQVPAPPTLATPPETAPAPRLVPVPATKPDEESSLLPPPRSFPDLPPSPKSAAGPDGSTPPKKADAEQLAVLLGAARNAAKQGDFDLAIARYEQYYRLNPEDVKGLEELAGAYFQADRLGEAATAYELLIRTFRNQPADKRDDVQAARILLILSDLAIRANDPSRAISRLFETLAVASDDKLQGARAVRLDAAARIAQMYLSEDQYPKACDTLLKYFAGIRVDDKDVPVRLVGLLLDLERPKVALQYLPPLVERFPEDPELYAAQVRAYAMLGDRLRTTQAVEVLQAKVPKAVDTRISLATQLIGIEEFDFACQVIAQAQAVRPANNDIGITLARAQVATFRLTQARLTLDAVKPVGPRQERDWMLVRARSHLASGEWTQSKLLYDALLKRDPFDFEARLGLGDVYSTSRELEKAKGEYCKVPPTSRFWRPARRGHALALSTQRHFRPAIDMLEETLREAPWDPQTVAVYLRVLGRAGMGKKAVEVATGYLQTCPPLPSAEATVRASFGRALMDTAQPLEADQQFAAALVASRHKSALAVYGLTRIGHMFGDPLRFPPPALADQPVDELRYRVLLADYYTDDRDDVHSLEFAIAAIRLDPQNLAAMTRAADAQQRIARQTGKVDDAVGAAKAVIACSPSNNRALFALARTLSIGKFYADSATAYQRLVSLDTEAALPKRELARVYYTDHQFELAHDTYLSTASADPVAAFRQTLQTIATRTPAGKTTLDGLALAKLPPDEIRSEVNKVVANCQDPLLAAGLLAAVGDYEARVVDAKGAELEARAKDFKGLRDLSAIPAYKELITAEPDNADALFDLGQIYSARQMTRPAIQTYSDLLAVDPQSREGMIATDRAALEASPTIRTFFRAEHENGRNGLANMDRLFAGMLFTTPLGDENEYLGVGYTRVRYSPTADGGPLSGNMPTLVVQKRVPIYDQTLFRGVFNVEQFPDRLNTRPTFDTGFTTNGDGWRTGSAAFLENVVASGESLEQDIYRFGARLDGEYTVNRRLTVGGLARYAHYSDDNDVGEISLNSAYIFTWAPKQLRLLLYTDNMFFREVTVFGPNAPQTLDGTIHPYFSPTAFSYYEARLDYTEWLSRDYFAHSNQCSYNLQGGIGFDNNAIAYGVGRAGFNWDIKPWLSVGADARFTYSNVYQFGSLYLYLNWRLPNCPRL
ncbi:MAG: tetratricopeptide repeat protein [Fimbriiglobus sp.]